MTADLRTRLKALVAQWREDVADKGLRQSTRSSVLYCADQLAALLAESEPVDWSQPQDLIITIEGPLPEPAPLKLGHPYENHHEDQGVDCSLAGLCHYGAGLRKCGQPREAH